MPDGSCDITFAIFLLHLPPPYPHSLPSFRLAGYRTDVVEFVSTEHTPRNLLIRAVRQQLTPSPLLPPPDHQQHHQQHQSAVEPRTGRVHVASLESSQLQRQSQPPQRQLWGRQQWAEARDYLALRDYWGLTPRLEVSARIVEVAVQPSILKISALKHLKQQPKLYNINSKRIFCLSRGLSSVSAPVGWQ